MVNHPVVERVLQMNESSILDSTWFFHCSNFSKSIFFHPDIALFFFLKFHSYTWEIPLLNRRSDWQLKLLYQYWILKTFWLLLIMRIFFYLLIPSFFQLSNQVNRMKLNILWRYQVPISFWNRFFRIFEKKKCAKPKGRTAI